MNHQIGDAVNRATELELAEFLRAGERDFAQPLGERIDISAYARKIFCNAVRFESWEDSTLVGLAAMYCNDTVQRTAFITSVSVRSKWARQGIASRLLDRCIQFARDSDMRQIRLEVASESFVAIRMYRRYGFSDVCAGPTFITMQLCLDSKKPNDD